MEDKDKLLLGGRSADLEFDDDVTNFKCVQCDIVALNHFISDCNHVFCDICVHIRENDNNYKCPKCLLPVSTINRKDPSFEEDLLQLTAHCPNKKNGCKTLSMLIEIPGHLKRCKHATPTASSSDISVPTASEATAYPDIRQVINQMESMATCNSSPPMKHADQLNGKQTAPLSTQPARSSNYQSKELEANRQRLIARKNPMKQHMDTMEPKLMDRKPQIYQEVPQSARISNQKFRAIPGKEYNVLLMGPTGVGKSTFINAFTNYLTFENMDEAVERDPLTVIPCQFSISDENFKQQTVYFGSDPNENMESKGQSATQSCKAYEFPLDNFLLRIIDTPGIGDTRGIDQDRLNIDGILNFISNYDDLYAVCILLKPNDSRLTPLFSFCIKQLLCHLHASASNNIVFIFTNSRNTFYRPGDTITPLTTLLDKIRTTPPYPKIPFEKNNIFCLDNEAFRFLVALKNGIQFSGEDRDNFGQSWSKSVDESKRMIRYIVEGSDGHGLTPHNVQDTLSVNQARDAIIELARPISELTKNIQANIQVLNEHKKEIEDCKDDEDKLKTKLYMPVVSLEIKEIGQPRTVCTGENCREAHQMGDQVKYHYPKRCHDPCYLDEVPREIVGAEGLRHCAAINSHTANCDKCGCHYSKHLHIYYESEVVDTKEVDPNVEKQLQTKAGIIQAAQDMVKKLEAEVKKYEAEEKILTDSTAKLAVFLKHNAMVVCNDAFKEYLNELIENEKSLSFHGSRNGMIIGGLQKMLKSYEIEKQILENALKNPTTHECIITTRDVADIIDRIANMKISGVIFRKTVQAQEKTKGSRSMMAAGKSFAKNVYKRFFN